MKIYEDFISINGIQNLKNYKYASTGYTELDLMMNPFWYKVTEFLPRSLAPNLITLIAAAFNVIPAIFLISYDPAFSSNVPTPAWVYLMVGISVFIYQTLDAVDGKQARRINQSSPIGQLMDHGFDSISFLYC